MGIVWRLGCLLLILMLIGSAISAIATGGHLHLIPLPLLVGFFALLIILGAAVRALSAVATPVDEIIEAAGKIERGDYSAQIREGGPSQVRSVARAFNSMSKRLKSSDERRRSFLADVVHELRTPLAVIRGQAEGIADGVYPADTEHIAAIVDATRSLEVLVEDLRALALSDSGTLVLAREPVDVAVLLHDVVASFEAAADEAGVTLSAEAAEDLPQADIDPVRIRSAVGNIVVNAIRHTPAGGSVRIRAGVTFGWIDISVADSGEGIPPELLPRVFERFVRGRGSTGSGLGLAIVHDTVIAHGGSIDIDSRPGSGTSVRMRLPVATAT